jgi:O-antigen/teichoic acid export membrane protein
MFIVPILLLANLFLGIYYNLSIWYRFTNNTKLGAMIAAGAAILTIVLNIALIPSFGFVACAWITLGVYAGMTVVSYFIGKHYYPVPYHVGKYLIVLLTALLLWMASNQLICHIQVKWLEIAINISLLSLFLLIIWLLQPKRKNA